MIGLSRTPVKPTNNSIDFEPIESAEEFEGIYTYDTGNYPLSDSSQDMYIVIKGDVPSILTFSVSVTSGSDFTVFNAWIRNTTGEWVLYSAEDAEALTGLDANGFLVNLYAPSGWTSGSSTMLEIVISDR